MCDDVFSHSRTMVPFLTPSFSISATEEKGNTYKIPYNVWGESVTYKIMEYPTMLGIKCYCKIMSSDKGIDVSAAPFQYLPRHHILSFFGD